MRSKRLLALVSLLTAAAVHATTLLALDVPALTRSSSVVARATVKSVKPRWTRDHARIVTDVTLELTETWKGAPAKEVVIVQPGGEVGEVGQLVAGTGRFTPGEDVLVFLEPRAENHYLLTGMLQGKFKVERSSDGKATFARQELEGDALFIDPATRQPVQVAPVLLPLETLRAQVLAASGATAPQEPTRPGPVKVTP